MKRKITALLILLITNNFILSMEKKHLILHFDINKTIIAMDSVREKTLPETINAILAEFTYCKWDNQNTESFYSYINKQIQKEMPNLSSISEEFKQKRRERLKQFPIFLKKQFPKIYEQYMHTKNHMMNLLSTEKMTIFPSFLKLITWLETKKIPYTLHLRTFGRDLSDIIPIIERKLPLKFAAQGKFNKSALIIGNQTIDNHKELYNLLCQQTHYAITDSYQDWKLKNCKYEGGKPFYIDLSNTQKVSIFFDDNAYNAIKPMEPNGRLKNIDKLIELGNIVVVNPKEAILNPDYFINKVKAKLK